ncbi:hypothetical protein AGMMS49579_03750 [Spirochaetia bacterium]|nr:hypothetical protein AGMMS49579_03750 [Spirochaetia bacterium]
MSKIEDFYPLYFFNKDNFYDKDLLAILNNMKEFSDLKLEKREGIGNVFSQTKYQIFIQRLLSIFTMFDGLLLIHEMGTGKTCTAISTIEFNINNPSHWAFNMKGAIVLTRGKTLMNNFMDELIYKCTFNKYQNFTRKLLSKFYNFYTFEIFAKYLKSLSDYEKINKFNHMIIIIDEAHNIRPQEGTLSVYLELHKFIHLLPDKKVLLLTGTPMRDSPDEIIPLLNLILPLSIQITNLNDIKKYAYGRVSFLKAEDSDINRIFVGQSIGNLKNFKVDPLRMQSFQDINYSKAYKMDKTEKGIYINSRQASLMVYPDGSWGKTGFDKYVLSGKSGFFSFTKLFKDYLRTNNLNTLSILYSTLIQRLKDAVNSKEKSFVYCDIVHGSGLIPLMLLLEENGFKRNKGYNGITNSYAIITNETTSVAEFRRIINLYNNENNFDGSNLSIILGSRVIAEGITLKDTINCHVLTPHWNYSEISQAIARIWRIGSHDVYIQKTSTIPTVKVYQYVSLSTTLSITLIMYETSEKKDVDIAKILRQLKESAIDCELFKKRNEFSSTFNYLKECEYTICNYTCDISNKPSTKEILLNYDNIYLDESTLRNKLQNLFIKNSINSITDIINTLKTTSFQTYEILRRIMFFNMPLKNIYNHNFFLKKVKGLYFLGYNNYYDSYLDTYYTKHPYLFKIKQKDYFKQIVDNIANTKTFNICSVDSFVNLSTTLQQRLLEIAISAKIIDQPNWPYGKPIDEQQFIYKRIFRDEILKFFDKYYIILDTDNNEWVSGKTFKLAYAWLDNKDRCLYQPTIKTKLSLWQLWVTCKKVNKQSLYEYKKNKTRVTFKSPVGYYGIYNPKNDKFCLKEDADEDQSDKRKIVTGRLCTTWDRLELTRIISIILKLTAPIEFTMKEAESIYKKNHLLLKLLPDNRTDDLYRSTAYWGNLRRKVLCEVLHKWFKDNNLIVEDFLCGVQAKRK